MRRERRSLECLGCGRKEQNDVPRPSFTASAASAAARCTYSTQISLCNYTLPPLASANTSLLILRKQTEPASSITNTPVTVTFATPPAKQHRIILQQQFYKQRVCCDHKFADHCSVRDSPTRPRSSPLRLDPQASPAPAPSIRTQHTLTLTRI